MNKITSKLLLVQSTLVAPKGQYNSFGKYKYRSAEDIVEAVKPLLKDHKLVMTLSDTIENIGNRYYIKATVKLTCTESGESIEVYGYAREEESKKGMDGSQITGASSSYARKYAMNGMFAIDDNKDSDSKTNDYGGEIKKPKQQSRNKQQDIATVNKKMQDLVSKYQSKEKVYELLKLEEGQFLELYKNEPHKIIELIDKHVKS